MRVVCEAVGHDGLTVSVQQALSSYDDRRCEERMQLVLDAIRCFEFGRFGHSWDSSKFKRLLRGAASVGATFDEYDATGATLLGYAAEQGNAAACRELIREGDVDVDRGRRGDSAPPLLMAAQRGHHEALRSHALTHCHPSNDFRRFASCYSWKARWWTTPAPVATQLSLLRCRPRLLLSLALY